MTMFSPPLLVVWGRYDPSFTVAGGEAYGKDVPSAEIHILDAGHFALDQKADENCSPHERLPRSAEAVSLRGAWSDVDFTIYVVPFLRTFA